MAAVSNVRTVAVVAAGVTLVGVVGAAWLGYRYITEPAYTYVLKDETQAARFQTTVDGTRAAAGALVELSLWNRYHLLPGTGQQLRSVQCPPLKFTVGATVTCEGVADGDGSTLRIPVRVTEVTAAEVTWRFER